MNELSTNESENSALGQYYMRSVLLKVFFYYSSTRDRTRVAALSQVSFVQLLKESGIISEEFSVERADLMVRSFLKRQKSFSFQSFCETCVILAEFIYPQEASLNPVEALLRLLTTYIMPLYTSLISRGLIQNFDLNLSPPVLQLLATTHKYLSGLYKLYFSWETSSAQSPVHIKKLSEKSLLSLLLKYKVYPDIITRSLFKSIWEQIHECPPEFVSLIPCQNIGKVFTYQNFLAFLLISSAFGTFKHKFDNLFEKCLNLLETMEVCSEKNESFGGPVVSRQAQYKQNTSKTKTQILRSEVFIVFNYLKYFGNPKEINFRKLKDLLVNLGIVIENIYEVELIYNSFVKKGEIVTPEIFLEVFLKISKKITDREDSFDVLLDCVLESPWFLNNKSRMQGFIEKISSEDLANTCQKFEKSIKPFLAFYGRAEVLAFEDLLKFLIDFQLYPDLIPRSRLDEIFYCFCVGENSENLSLDSCVLVIEICAVLAFIPNLNDNEKLNSVLQRAIHGPGPDKAQSIKGLNRTSALMKAVNVKAKLKEQKKGRTGRNIEKLLSNLGSPNKNTGAV